MKYLLIACTAFLMIACNNQTQTKTAAETIASDCLGPKPEQPCITTREYNPVCGCDGNTYPNPGSAACAGVLKFEKGACAEDKPQVAAMISKTSQYEVLTVTKVEYGRDGYGVTLENGKGSIFKSTISIPNLGDEYKDMKVGEKVIIEGDYQESDPVYIMAKKIIKQQ